MNVDILLYEGFDELDAVGPFEVFQNADGAADAVLDPAQDVPHRCRARFVTLEPTGLVTASHGMRVDPDATLPDPDHEDAPHVLVVPGGGWNDRSEAGARAEYERGAISEAVARHYDAGCVVASVCTGGMLLEKAGVLDGRPAVTHAGALDDLRASEAVVPEADTPTGVPRVVDDGNVLTCGGVTSGIDLALHLVEREFGASVADHVAREMEYERRD